MRVKRAAAPNSRNPEQRWTRWLPGCCCCLAHHRRRHFGHPEAAWTGAARRACLRLCSADAASCHCRRLNCRLCTAAEVVQTRQQLAREKTDSGSGSLLVHAVVVKAFSSDLFIVMRCPATTRVDRCTASQSTPDIHDAHAQHRRCFCCRQFCQPTKLHDERKQAAIDGEAEPSLVVVTVSLTGR